jgi:hypothetical protein
MRILILLVLGGFPLIAHGQFCYFPESTENLFNQSMQLIRPSHVTWVKSSATQLNTGKLETDQVERHARAYLSGQRLAETNIEALMFLVLMEAAKSAQEDIKAVMASIKSINEKKKKQRQALKEMQSGKSTVQTNVQLDSLKRAIYLVEPTGRIEPVRPVAIRKLAKTDIEQAIGEIRDKHDSLSELGEMEQLRLQMAMDRLSKMMATLSNLLKKISDTAQQITQNLK